MLGYTSAQLLLLSSLARSMLGGCNYEVGGQKEVRKKDRERRKNLSALLIAETLSSCATVMPDQHCVLDEKCLGCVFFYLLRRRGNALVDGECPYCMEQEYSGLFFFLAFRWHSNMSSEETADGLINGAAS